MERKRGNESMWCVLGGCEDVQSRVCCLTPEKGVSHRGGRTGGGPTWRKSARARVCTPWRAACVFAPWQPQILIPSHRFATHNKPRTPVEYMAWLGARYDEGRIIVSSSSSSPSSIAHHTMPPCPCCGLSKKEQYCAHCIHQGYVHSIYISRSFPAHLTADPGGHTYTLLPFAPLG